MHRNSENETEYLQLLEFFLKYIHKNKEVLKKYLLLSNFKDDINRLSKIISNIIYRNYSGQEFINDLYINITDKYFILNYCIDAWFEEELDTDPHATFETCIMKIDFSSIYFISGNNYICSYKHNEIDDSVDYKTSDTNNSKWKMINDLDNCNNNEIKQVTDEIDEHLLLKK